MVLFEAFFLRNQGRWASYRDVPQRSYLKLCFPSALSEEATRGPTNNKVPTVPSQMNKHLPMGLFPPTSLDKGSLTLLSKCLFPQTAVPFATKITDDRIKPAFPYFMVL